MIGASSKQLTRGGFCAVLLAGLLPFAGAPAVAGTTTWQHDPATPGDWFLPTNWTNGVPGAADSAYIENGGTAKIASGGAAAWTIYLGRTGTGNLLQTGGVHNIVEALRMGVQAGSEAAYTLAGGVLASGRSLYIGVNQYSTARFVQTGGVHIANGLELNNGPNSVYELIDGELYHQYIPDFSAPKEHLNGIFIQRGGKHFCAATIELYGRYELSGGSLTVGEPGTGGGRVFISRYGGSGSFVQGGGAVQINGGLYMSVSYAILSTYSISGGELVVNGAEYIGYGAPAAFEQSGGTHTLNGAAWMGGWAGTSPPNRGQATYTLTGGTHQVNGALHLAVGTTDSTAAYILSGGSLEVTDEYLGEAGQGTVEQSAGAHRVNGTLHIGYAPKSLGRLVMAGGSLIVNRLEAGTFSGEAVIDITDAAAYIEVQGDLRLGQRCTFRAVPGTTIHMTGAVFSNWGRDPRMMAGLENLELIFEGGAGSTDTLEVAGFDRGAVEAGFDDNYALGTLRIGAGGVVGKVRLVNLFDNWFFDPTAEALYVNTLIIEPGGELDLNGLNLYYRDLRQNGGTILLNGGSLTYVPEPGALGLLGVGLAGVSVRRRSRRRASVRPGAVPRVRGRARGLLLVLVGPLLAAAMTSPAPAQPAGGGWPQESYDQQRTARSPYVGPRNPYIAWTSPEASFTGRPAVRPDGVVVAGRSGTGISAISPADGSVLWSAPTDYSVSGTPAVGADGTIYIGAVQNVVYAVAANGSRVWKLPGRGSSFATTGGGLLREDNTIVFTTSAGYNNTAYLMAVDGVSGKLLWETPIAGTSGTFHGLSNPVQDLWGNISCHSYFSMTGQAYGFDANGKLLWINPDPEPRSGDHGAVGPSGLLYYGGANGKLAAIFPDTGVTWWLTDVGNAWIRSPAIGADGTVYATADDGFLRAYDWYTGSVLWAFNAGQSCTTALAIDAEGVLYFGAKKTLFAVTPQGQELWRLALPEEMSISPVLGAPGRLYVVGSGGHIFAIVPEPACAALLGLGGLVILRRSGKRWVSGPADSAGPRPSLPGAHGRCRRRRVIRPRGRWPGRRLRGPRGCG